MEWIHLVIEVTTSCCFSCIYLFSMFRCPKMFISYISQIIQPDRSFSFCHSSGNIFFSCKKLYTWSLTARNQATTFPQESQHTSVWSRSFLHCCLSTLFSHWRNSLPFNAAARISFTHFTTTDMTFFIWNDYPQSNSWWIMLYAVILQQCFS